MKMWFLSTAILFALAFILGLHIYLILLVGETYGGAAAILYGFSPIIVAVLVAFVGVIHTALTKGTDEHQNNTGVH